CARSGELGERFAYW
nr:immunoglobulin heavy chain junction region [Mus musculus]